jgi:hypothetical protein
LDTEVEVYYRILEIIRELAAFLKSFPENMHDFFDILLYKIPILLSDPYHFFEERPVVISTGGNIQKLKEEVEV